MLMVDYSGLQLQAPELQGAICTVIVLLCTHPLQGFAMHYSYACGTPVAHPIRAMTACHSPLNTNVIGR